MAEGHSPREIPTLEEIIADPEKFTGSLSGEDGPNGHKPTRRKISPGDITYLPDGGMRIRMPDGRIRVLGPPPDPSSPGQWGGKGGGGGAGGGQGKKPQAATPQWNPYRHRDLGMPSEVLNRLKAALQFSTKSWSGMEVIGGGSGGGKLAQRRALLTDKSKPAQKEESGGKKNPQEKKRGGRNRGQREQ